MDIYIYVFDLCFVRFIDFYLTNKNVLQHPFILYVWPLFCYSEKSFLCVQVSNVEKVAKSYTAQVKEAVKNTTKEYILPQQRVRFNWKYFVY